MSKHYEELSDSEEVEVRNSLKQLGEEKWRKSYEELSESKKGWVEVGKFAVWGVWLYFIIKILF